MTEKKTEVIKSPSKPKTEGRELDAIKAAADNIREYLPDEKLVNKAIQEVGGEVAKAGRLLVGAIADDSKGESLLDRLLGK